MYIMHDTILHIYLYAQPYVYGYVFIAVAHTIIHRFKVLIPWIRTKNMLRVQTDQ
jgi:hypothetical protein